jgi:NAD+ kinase
VLIIKKIGDDDINESFIKLALWLVREKHMDVYVESKVMDDPLIVRHPTFADIRDLLITFKEGVLKICGLIDFIICLGGDGTLLYASTLFQGSVPPVMAFHLGSLGFLSPFEFKDFEEQITEVLQGASIRLMLRTRLECSVMHDRSNLKNGEARERQTILALNEVVLDRGASPYLCQFDLYIQHQQVTVVQGDGVIISTPTGSTAYAAAAGASIVHPNVPAIIIAPICPHSLSFRPIIVPAGVEIKVMVSSDARGDAWASFDGRQRQRVAKGDALIINTSKYPLPSICHSDPVRDWFDSLAACLHWNVRKPQLPLSSSSRALSDMSDKSSDTRESSSEPLEAVFDSLGSGSDSNNSVH